MARIYGLNAVQDLTRIVYVFEEANTYFDSYSLRKSDDHSAVLSDFVSVGRNFGLRGFLVVTAEAGELSPGFRRRATGRILGRVLNEYDLREICRGRTYMKDVFRKMPQYHWIYYHGGFSDVFRILDTVQTTPTDFKISSKPSKIEENVEVVNEPPSLTSFVIALMVLIILILLALRIQ